jgi:penicillin amidase
VTKPESIFDTLLGSAARTGLTWLSRQRLPQIDGRLTLPGLVASVEIIRDRWGIPHIYAANHHDLFFAQGFVHAQDRLWQLELNRRLATGRLSEIFGPVALETDRAIRTFGFPRLAQADWTNAAEEVALAIEAYTQGINAFLDHRSTRLPLEFTILRHRPEPWQPEDSLAFMRLTTWQFSHAWYGQIVRAQLIEVVGEAAAAELEIHYPDQNPVTLPEGIEFNRLDLDGLLQRAAGPFLNRGQGSNAWAVSAGRTTTGRPYLCNDVHLALRVPSTWYELHLVGGRFNVSGASLLGVPLVVVGHNARLAWGLTLAFTDCEDLFVERFDPHDPHRYLFRDEWRPAEVISETIQVKGQAEPHREQIILTQHGPVISDVVGAPDQRIALNSMSLRAATVAAGWWRLNLAGNWDEFVEAMRHIEAPQLNVAYADVEGNIGYWLTGRVPIRAKGQGLVPAPGWTGEYEWVDEVPFEAMPHALNPEQGYVASCNHRVIAADYPYYLGSAWVNGYRARRLVELFGGQEKLAVDDFRAMQLDVTCLPGRELVAQLAGLTGDDPDVRLALAELRAWDGRLTTTGSGATLYEVLRYILVRNLLEPGLGPALTVRLMGQGSNPVLFAAHEFYGHDTVTMLRMLVNPDSWWVARAGGREAVLNRSLKQAVEWLRAKLGPEVGDWQWGKIHRVFFVHPLGQRKPFDRVFNRGPFPIGGDTDTLCQTAIQVAEPYDSRAWAPSYRQIIDLGDLSRSLAVFPTGQSGHAGSPHYDDLLELWLNGDYHPMLWTRAQVEQAAEGRLKLTPQ